MPPDQAVLMGLGAGTEHGDVGQGSRELCPGWLEATLLGHVVDVTVYILTTLLCIWSVHSYACATRGQNTEAKAAAKKYERRLLFRRWREDPTIQNLWACVFVKVSKDRYLMVNTRR